MIFSFFLLKIVNDKWKKFFPGYSRNSSMRCKTRCGWWKLAFSDPESTCMNTLENSGNIYEWDFRWGYFWQYCSKWFSKTSLLVRRIFLRTSLSTSSWGRFKITRGNEVTQNLQTFYSHTISIKFCKKTTRKKILKHFCQFPLCFAEKRSGQNLLGIYLFCFLIFL